MMSFASWLVCGLVVGCVGMIVSRATEEYRKLWPIMIVSVVGSFVTGLINWWITGDQTVASGFMGALLLCWMYDKWHIFNISNIHQFERRIMNDELNMTRRRIAHIKKRDKERV